MGPCPVSSPPAPHHCPGCRQTPPAPSVLPYMRKSCACPGAETRWAHSPAFRDDRDPVPLLGGSLYWVMGCLWEKSAVLPAGNLRSFPKLRGEQTGCELTGEGRLSHVCSGRASGGRPCLQWEAEGEDREAGREGRGGRRGSALEGAMARSEREPGSVAAAWSTERASQARRRGLTGHWRLGAEGRPGYGDGPGALWPWTAEWGGGLCWVSEVRRSKGAFCPGPSTCCWGGALGREEPGCALGPDWDVNRVLAAITRRQEGWPCVD